MSENEPREFQVRMARATDEDLRLVREFLDFMETQVDEASLTSDFPILQKYVEANAQGSFERIVLGYQVLRDSLCDPTLTYLDVNQDIKELNAAAGGLLGACEALIRKSQYGLPAYVTTDEEGDYICPFCHAPLFESGIHHNTDVCPFALVEAAVAAAKGEPQLAPEPHNELLTVCEELFQAMIDCDMSVDEDPPYKHRQMMRRAQAAIAAAKGNKTHLQPG